jgi:hypothetical protein
MNALKAFALPRPRNRIKAAYITRCHHNFNRSNEAKRISNEVVVDEKKPKFFRRTCYATAAKEYNETIESSCLYWCYIALLTSLAAVSRQVERDPIGPG